MKKKQAWSQARMVERVHFYKNCLLQMLQFMVAYLEACLSDFYLAATGVYIWIPFSETGSTDIPCVGYVCEFLVSRVARVAQIKKIQKTKPIYFRILILGGPVNWSPTHSTGPQPIQLVPKPFNCSPKTVFYRYLSISRSNKKNNLFSNFASGKTLPTHSTGPQPIQLVPKHCF